MTWLAKEHSTALEGCGSLRNGFGPLNVAVDRNRGDEHPSANTAKQLRRAVEALTACQAWRQQEGVFTALTPAMHRIASQPRRIQTGLRSCEADLEQALIIGRRYSVLAESHYDKPLAPTASPHQSNLSLRVTSVHLPNAVNKTP
jgi:hypothetical protein